MPTFLSRLLDVVFHRSREQRLNDEIQAHLSAWSSYVALLPAHHQRGLLDRRNHRDCVVGNSEIDHYLELLPTVAFGEGGQPKSESDCLIAA